MPGPIYDDAPYCEGGTCYNLYNDCRDHCANYGGYNPEWCKSQCVDTDGSAIACPPCDAIVWVNAAYDNVIDDGHIWLSLSWTKMPNSQNLPNSEATIGSFNIPLDFCGDKPQFKDDSGTSGDWGWNNSIPHNSVVVKRVQSDWLSNKAYHFEYSNWDPESANSFDDNYLAPINVSLGYEGHCLTSNILGLATNVGGHQTTYGNLAEIMIKHRCSDPSSGCLGFEATKFLPDTVGQGLQPNLSADCEANFGSNCEGWLDVFPYLGGSNGWGGSNGSYVFHDGTCQDTIDPNYQNLPNCGCLPDDIWAIGGGPSGDYCMYISDYEQYVNCQSAEAYPNCWSTNQNDIPNLCGHSNSNWCSNTDTFGISDVTSIGGNFACGGKIHDNSHEFCAALYLYDNEGNYIDPGSNLNWTRREVAKYYNCRQGNDECISSEWERSCVAGDWCMDWQFPNPSGYPLDRNIHGDWMKIQSPRASFCSIQYWNQNNPDVSDVYTAGCVPMINSMDLCNNGTCVRHGGSCETDTDCQKQLQIAFIPTFVDMISPYGGPNAERSVDTWQIDQLEGCRNPSACNFNPLSIIDDGSCILIASQPRFWVDSDSDGRRDPGQTDAFQWCPGDPDHPNANPGSYQLCTSQDTGSPYYDANCETDDVEPDIPCPSDSWSQCGNCLDNGTQGQVDDVRCDGTCMSSQRYCHNPGEYYNKNTAECKNIDTDMNGNLAVYNGCSECVGGTTGDNTGCGDSDNGCGCGIGGPQLHYWDADGDGIGSTDEYGATQYCATISGTSAGGNWDGGSFSCEQYELAPAGWVTQSGDPDPNCPNWCGNGSQTCRDQCETCHNVGAGTTYAQIGSAWNAVCADCCGSIGQQNVHDGCGFCCGPDATGEVTCYMSDWNGTYGTGTPQNFACNGETQAESLCCSGNGVAENGSCTCDPDYCNTDAQVGGGGSHDSCQGLYNNEGCCGGTTTQADTICSEQSTCQGSFQTVTVDHCEVQVSCCSGQVLNSCGNCSSHTTANNMAEQGYCMGNYTGNWQCYKDDMNCSGQSECEEHGGNVQFTQMAIGSPQQAAHEGEGDGGCNNDDQCFHQARSWCFADEHSEIEYTGAGITTFEGTLGASASGNCPDTRVKTWATNNQQSWHHARPPMGLCSDGQPTTFGNEVAQGGSPHWGHHEDSCNDAYQCGGLGQGTLSYQCHKGCRNWDGAEFKTHAEEDGDWGWETWVQYHLGWNMLGQARIDAEGDLAPSLKDDRLVREVVGSVCQGTDQTSVFSTGPNGQYTPSEIARSGNVNYVDWGVIDPNSTNRKNPMNPHNSRNQKLGGSGIIIDDSSE